MSTEYFVLGSIVTFVTILIISGLVGLFYFADLASRNRLIRITNWTAGKPYVEQYRAKKMKHKELGDVYYISQLKREKRHFIPYFGTDTEYPTNKNKLFFVPVTFHNGVYVPESYNPYHDKEVEVIEPVEITQSGKTIQTFKKIKKKITIFVSKTIPQSNRMFYLKSDIAIEREFSAKEGWWAKNGHYVVSLGIVGVAGIVAAVMIIFGYEAYSDMMAGTAPAWLQTLVDAVQGGQAPPTP